MAMRMLLPLLAFMDLRSDSIRTSEDGVNMYNMMMIMSA